MPVDELRAGEREPARLGGELAGVRVRADRRRLEATGARDHDAARQHLGVDRLVDRVRLAGEQRLVELETVGGAHDAVGRNLVARTQLEQVVEDDRLDRALVEPAVPHDARHRRAQHGEPVEGPLGPDLLHDADQRVRDQDDPEQGVLRCAEHQDHDEQRAEDRVEPGEDVGPDDLAVRAAGPLAGVVRLPPSDPLRDLGAVRPTGRVTKPGPTDGDGSRPVCVATTNAAHGRRSLPSPAWSTCAPRSSTRSTGRATSCSPTAAPSTCGPSAPTTATSCRTSIRASRTSRSTCGSSRPSRRPPPGSSSRSPRSTTTAASRSSPSSATTSSRSPATTAPAPTRTARPRSRSASRTISTAAVWGGSCSSTSPASRATRGIRRFEAWTMPNNHKMLRVFSDAGFEVSRRFDAGTVEVSFAIERTTESVAVQHDREHRAEARSMARMLAPRYHRGHRREPAAVDDRPRGVPQPARRRVHRSRLPGAPDRVVGRRRARLPDDRRRPRPGRPRGRHRPGCLRAGGGRGVRARRRPRPRRHLGRVRRGRRRPRGRRARHRRDRPPPRDAPGRARTAWASSTRTPTSR